MYRFEPPSSATGAFSPRFIIHPNIVFQARKVILKRGGKKNKGAMNYAC